MKKMWRLILCVFILAVGMTGCLEKNNIEPKVTASVSIYHSSPDAPELNIIMDKVVINLLQAFKYKNYSNYLEVEAGIRNFRFNAYSTGTNLVETNLDFEANKVYSLFVMNTLSRIELLRTVDVTDPPASGNARVRFIHLSPDAPEIDIIWGGETTPVFSGQIFKQASAFKDVPAKTYSMQVKVKGGSGITLVVPDVQIKEAGYFTILVEGFDILPANNANALSARVIGN